MNTIDLEALRELRASLIEDHRMNPVTCGKGCGKYECTHTLGGYEIGSSLWKTRVEGLKALDAAINALEPVNVAPLPPWPPTTVPDHA